MLRNINVLVSALEQICECVCTQVISSHENVTYISCSTFQSNSGSNGVIYIHRSRMKFIGHNYFHGNNGSSLKVRQSSVHVAPMMLHI